ncbi:hypothetical protein B14_200048 (plasmid) [Bacillus licheniformis]|nr:hypothetical protein B14_200048 [Bacillus licheniformis]ARW46100.1 hypothetical protein S100141_04880 [Bacillus licheniformis]
MRGRNIIPIMNNNIARTTPGLVYNIHTDSRSIGKEGEQRTRIF